MGSELGVTPDSKPEPVYSPVSIWWATWAGVWTVLVASGIAYLIARRDTPILRIRGLGLSLSAIVLLHLYYAPVQFGTMIGPIMPGDAQFWIMGTFLPCGIALFHASNSRFLYVAKLQEKYVYNDRRLIDFGPNQKKSGLIGRFKRLDYNTRILVLVGMGMIAQILLTIIMWLISRKWHPTWGIPGTEVTGPKMAQLSAMGRGWEWWPSIFWQLFWAWIFAPIVLWKSRNIRDTHGWRVQTIGCAIANLPGAPLWLISLYVPAFDKVNQVWLPPQWVCLSILVMEIFTVFLPCWEVMRHQALRKETLDAIAQWEEKNKKNSSASKSLAETATLVESIMTGGKSTNGSVQTNHSRDSILTMGALEYALERDPAPLQRFSALSDFSGENIAFLTSVAEWKDSFPKAIRDNTAPRDSNTEDLIRERFNRALRIYAEFISVTHAEFPINISSQDLRKLQDVFEQPARILYGDEREVDPATPFDTFKPPASPTYSNNSQKELQSSVSAIHDRVQYWGDVPESFGPNVFDDAQESIKYLVLTNTWPKFVKTRTVSIDSGKTMHGMNV
ncbi:hypothetical protein Asppvi_001790 [Aspergillus pseudoviridinutans]|uniref:RGS domain-containing protein n=1 Tax=Aspergillus pseudoviridinutans TaxID=1517512 RepID=A0A9P3F0H0_9EURO|nr:uncharacterized protein Asppvi_001790 [Aspergillus pseudoviridinutans]GIJ92512.1 hypothetical protein Asppvi_001790 [Aspergillus pseudoviridinutans]